MRNLKIVSLMTFLMVISTSTAAIASSTAIQIIGADELKALTPALEKTVYTRCLTRGVDLNSQPQLEITISSLGTIISFDALLRTSPPRAYHKDLEDSSGLSAAVDEMITAIFDVNLTALPPALAAAPEHKNSTTKQIGNYELPFTATSVIAVQGRIYIADKKNIHIFDNGSTKPWWKAPNLDSILRLYSFDGEIYALTAHANSFYTYRISNGSTVESWSNPVIPMGGGLASASLRIPPDISGTRFRWSNATAIKGSPHSLPPNTDILAATISDVLPTYDGNELVTFDQAGNLTIMSRGDTVWNNDVRMGNTPQYIEDSYNVRGHVSDGKKSATKSYTLRYYLPNRILVTPDNAILTFQNGKGTYAILRNVNAFKSSRLLSYRWSDSEMAEDELAKSSMGYCADIAMDDGKAFFLSVSKKKSYLKILALN